MKKSRRFGIYTDNDTHFKLHYICEYEGRSVNGLISHLIQIYVKRFENKYGKIEVKEPEE